MMNVTLLTGASSGIGLELARLAAAEGHHLFLLARSQEKLFALKKELEANNDIEVFVLPMDLTQTDAVPRILRFLEEHSLEVDILVNNAGFGGMGTFVSRSWEQEDAMMQLNMRVLTELMKAMLPSMQQKGKGRVLNVASSAAFVPGPMQAVYHATKAYVYSLSLAVAEELDGTGVTVTVLCPGATKTEFAQEAGFQHSAIFRHAKPASEVAKIGWDAMLRGKLVAIAAVSWSLRLQMRIIGLMPRRYVLRRLKRMYMKH